MTSPPDSKWPRLLSFSVHEFSSPLSIVAGYIRMVLKDRAGAVTDQQRRLLEEAEKSCVRLRALLSEMSDLANLEASTATFNRNQVDLGAVLTDTIASLPEMPDREIRVTFTPSGTNASVQGDPVRLKAAFTSLLTALRRELVTSSELFVRERNGEFGGKPATWLAIGDEERIGDLIEARPESLATFDECRGGCGLSLAVARRVFDAHSGAIWSPADGTKAAAVLVLPHQGSGRQLRA